MKNTSLTRTIDDIMVFLKVVMTIVFIAYWFSGVRVIKPGEIGLVTRFGKLRGQTQAQQIHKPGWVFALPSPIEEVIMVPVKQVRELKITELSRISLVNNTVSDKADKNAALRALNSYDMSRTIDPVTEGYCVSGDENIFQTTVVVKYQISSPVAASFSFAESPDFDNLLTSVVVSEMTHTAGSLSIDGILSRQQQELALYVKNRSQERLDELDAGLLLLSIEFAELAPPVQVQQAFEEVNTAAINRKKEINEAMAFKEEVIPQARARARSTINNARVYLEETLASARGKSDSYTQLFSAYKESPAQIRADMLNKTREGIFSRVKDIVMLPEQSKSKTLFSAFIKGVSQGDTGYYYEGSND